jgi:hypothetical protein
MPLALLLCHGNWVSLSLQGWHGFELKAFMKSSAAVVVLLLLYLWGLAFSLLSLLASPLVGVAGLLVCISGILACIGILVTQGVMAEKARAMRNLLVSVTTIAIIAILLLGIMASRV